MSQEHNEQLQIQQLASLKPKHFADLIRAAQLIFDPTAGLSGRHIEVDWQEFGIPRDVEENLKSLGQEYRYASPHVPGDIIWGQLTPEARIWFLNHKDELWQFEEIFPALDED
ncbi:hypothetical protein JYQ62_11735 [Nostoc sp. UHCC 0702]|nr:hypothetical protein JYQ62_11735 [Nostoc sp. UHCC 0702]